MNDPGLDKPIHENSHQVENERDEGTQTIDDPNDSGKVYLEPSRWWFASTAFPLIAGTFGPVASAFNICAVIQSWRIEIPPGPGFNENHGIDLPDPEWLLAINGLSLGFALLANFALLLNMTRRLSFSIAQPVTIVGWYLAAFFLVGDLSGVIHIVKAPDQRRALTQAFYFAIYSAALYFIIASLMMVTVWGALKGHYSRDFKLSTSQRTLMLQTISFLIYMLGGAGVYARIEGWQFLDALYFTTFTLTTVGIGDYTPATHLGRGLLFPYAIGGILILGLVVGSIRSLVLERGKEKLGSRQLEKIREEVLKKMEKKGQTEKITPIQTKAQAAKIGMTERERRREEFQLMRQIQDRAHTRQKWTSLSVSATAWLVLWFIGALVFYFTEYEQSWSYFQSLYFSYVVLLTIGYGDFKPLSNSGKSFFVFWSLLAVPTLTILISNMGDTVVQGVKDVTLYLGEFTLLPGEAGIRSRLEQVGIKLKRGAKVSPFSPNIFRHKDSEQGRGTNGAAPSVSGPTSSDSGKEKAFSELSSHEYHHRLACELLTALHHLNVSPPRKYSYEEWARFLELLGEDEDDSDRHRKPTFPPEHEEKKKTDEPNREHQEETLSSQNAPAADKPASVPWSWLGKHSPLLVGGDVVEAEWLVHRLSRRLEKELKAYSESMLSQDLNK